MKKRQLLLFPILLMLISCSNINSTNNKEQIEAQIDFTEIKFEQSLDEIKFNAQTDNPEIKNCYNYNYVFQYFSLGSFEYSGGKTRLIDEILGKYNSSKVPKENGLIRIRFIINCEGKANRFRLLAMDVNYQEKLFDKSITNQLLEIVKGLEGWKIKYYKENPIDYYQYLLFKVENGEIIKILP